MVPARADDLVHRAAFRLGREWPYSLGKENPARLAQSLRRELRRDGENMKDKTSQEILDEAAKHGIRLALDATGEYLTIRPTPPPRLLAKIKKHEAEIVEILQWEEAREEPEEISPREARRDREIAEALRVLL